MPASRVRTRKGLLFEGELETPAAQMAGKRHSKKAQILALIRARGPLSRIEIARTLGFNHRSVSLLIDDLLLEKLVTEEPGRTTGSGRRPIPVALNPDAASVLGIDVTRSVTSLALMNLQGHVLHRDQRPNLSSSLESEQVRWLESFVLEFLSACGKNSPPLAGAALSPVGFLHLQLPVLRHEATAEPLRGHLHKLLRVPVLVETDSCYMALSEQWFGEARGVDDALVFNLSDGLGLSCIVDGRFLHGHRNWAGQVGHVPLGEPGVPCYCGSHSCLENTVSGSGILRLADQTGLKLGRSRTPEKVARLAEQGSPEARAIFAQFADRLATAVAVSIGLFAPDLVILGGPLSRFSHLFMGDFEAALTQIAIPTIRPDVRICVSTMSEDAVLLGTCAAMLNQIYGSPNSLPAGNAGTAP